MPSQFCQHRSGRVCGKKLPCSHRCSKGARSNHVCVCNRKWTFDPGCGHKVTGICSDFSKLGLPCLEWCGKVLDCGHPCVEPCNSDACICNLCLDNHSGVTSDSDDDHKSETEKSSATTNMVVYPTLKLVTPKVTSKSKYTNTTFDSPQFSERKVQVPQKAATNGKGFHGLQNDVDNNKPCSSKTVYGNGSANGPCSSKMAYGDPNCSEIPPKEQEHPTKVHIYFKDASGTPLQEVPEHQRSKLEEMLSHAIQSNEDPNAFELQVCLNGHPLHPDYHHCPICGYAARLPEVRVIHLPPGPEIHNELDMGLNDDNAWKLGFAKCVNAHYFRAALRSCDTCGKKAEYQLPDGYYSDSDSD